MPAICIPYYSQSGHIAALAQAIGSGAGDAHLVDITQASEADLDALHAAPAIVFGAPTYMGGVPARYGAFLEQVSSDWPDHGWRNKIAAGFTSACHPSGDKLHSLQRFSIFAAQMGMLWIGVDDLGPPVRPEAEGRNRDGSWLGLMATDAGDAPRPEDLLTAQRFGARVAAAVARWG